MRTSVAQSLAAIGLAVSTLGVGVGCGDLSGDAADGDTGGAPFASVLAEIDTNHFCDMVGVVDVVLRATPEPCPDGGSCSPIEGTVFSCPAIDATALLGVDLGQAGAYQLAAVASFTTGEEAPECFPADDGSATISVTDAQIESADPIIIESDHAPCPGT